MKKRSRAMRVEVLDRTGRAPVEAATLRRLIRSAGRHLGAPDGEVAVLLTGDAEIRRLNRQFRGRDSATDVLSFPDGVVGPEEQARTGDIVISIPAARRNARGRGHSPRLEILHLVIHGFIHLLGYDHEVDGGEMETLEGEMRRRLLRAEMRREAG